MTSSQIQSFISVVETQSFNQAEKKSYVSRQALKKQIDALEAELGVNLFVRTHLGTTLTPVGEVFYQGIKDVSNQVSDLINKCRNLSTHEYTIKIGSPAHPRLILEKAFLEFSKQYPYIKQDVVFIDEAKNVDLVLDGTVDVAECILSDEIVGNSKLAYVKLTDLPYKCILAATHPLANRKSISLKDLKGNTIGLRRNSNNKLIQKLKAECQDITLLETRGSSMETQQIFTICYNHGIFLSRAYYANFMTPLVTIPFDCDITAESCIIFKKSHSQTVQKFVDAVEACRAQVAGLTHTEAVP